MGAATFKKLLFLHAFLTFSFLQAKDLSDLNLALFDGPVSVVGKWASDKQKIYELYNEVTPALFGTYYLVDPFGGGLLDEAGNLISPMRPMHYVVGQKGEEKLVGYRILPLSNRPLDEAFEPDIYYPSTSMSADGEIVVGATALDDQLSQSFYGATEYPKLLSASLDTAEEKRMNIFSQFEVEMIRPVVGFLSYYHPEGYRGHLKALASNQGYESQGGFGHMGLYVGMGRDLDAPEGHGGNIHVESTPANLYSLKLKKLNSNEFEDAASVNKNFIHTARVLNRGIEFSNDYMRDVMRGVNLRNLLAIWRGWIDREWVFEDALTGDEQTKEEKTFYYKLINDAFWKFYCAEFATVAANIAVNVLHNEEYYKFLWPKDGEALFKKYVALQVERLEANFPGLDPKYYTGLDYVSVPKDAFTTLLKGDSALMAQRLANPQKDVMNLALAKEWGRNLVWPPAKTADLLSQFNATYFPWVRYGAVESSLLTLGLSQEALDRLQISLEDYRRVVAPIIAVMLAFDLASKYPASLESIAEWEKATAKAVKNLQDSFEQAFSLFIDFDNLNVKKEWQEFFVDIGAKLVENLDPHALDHVTSKSLYRRARSLRSQLDNGDESISAEYKAYRYFQFSVKEIFKEARRVSVMDEGSEHQMNVEDYSPPKITHTIEQGIHPSHRRIVITTEGTVMEADQVRKNEKDLVQLDPKAGL